MVKGDQGADRWGAKAPKAVRREEVIERRKGNDKVTVNSTGARCIISRHLRQEADGCGEPIGAKEYISVTKGILRDTPDDLRGISLMV